ncbi:hypothetical protein L873DRAFT_1802451 [Choiromyces venosus 120613-1]|uniref:Rhodopsin domain-containing protein n=1 Tax=Choiromyces venosus 120613-1 TaxID=1336337 RepID=A0A3N4JUK6_9PEZI|nr:hypothetical protein L873DRAFT_1802451 [Choiromyces venosus 120613-1]
MPLHRKIFFIILLGVGIFVTISAILRSALVFRDMYFSINMAHWAIHESCVGVIVGNAPMISPAFKKIFSCGKDRSKQSSCPVELSDYSNNRKPSFWTRGGPGNPYTIGDAVIADDETRRNESEKAGSTECINPRAQMGKDLVVQRDIALKCSL